jgi:hypothetical protein
MKFTFGQRNLPRSQAPSVKTTIKDAMSKSEADDDQKKIGPNKGQKEQGP